MYNTSQNYKNYIKEPSRMFESKIILGSITLNNDDVIQLKTELQQPSNGFTLGSCISKSLELTLKNDGGTYASAGVLDVSIGLKMGEIIEYIPQGLFNIDTVEKTDYTVKITAYDNMIKFETPYSEKYDNPTLKQVIQQLQTITGVEFDSSVTIPNYTLSKLSGYTCREILGFVASLMGGNAYITRNGKFTIVTPVEVDYTITADNYFDYNIEDNTYKIGMLTCQNKLKNDAVDESDDYEAIEEKNTISAGSLGADSMELTFINPWMTETILNSIYNKLKSFSFLGYSIKWQGDLSIDAGNIINVTDRHGVTRKALVFSDNINYNGGLTQETKAKGQTKRSNEFSTTESPTELDRISVKLLLAEKAIIQKANINDLTVVSAKVGTLDAGIANINTALINKANIDDLNATNANISNLNAQYANLSSAIINKADIAELNAANANISKLQATVADIGELKSTVADISTLVSGNLTSANIHSLVLTADKVTVQNGFIKNAMVESLAADKITSGTLNTNKLTISSNGGGLVLANNTIQFSDKDKNVRVQIGQDAKGDFNFIVKGADGKTVLLDSTGLHEGAISDGLIKTDMIADNSINSNKIDYSSVISGLNADGSNYINASKVAIDLTGQTLDIAFNSVKSTADSANSKIDNLSVGGRNLVKNSQTLNNEFAKLNTFEGTKTISEDSSAKSGKVIKIECTTAGTGFFCSLWRGDDSDIGKKFTWSFYAKMNTNKTLSNIGHERGGKTSISITTEWQKFTHTWTYSSSGNRAFVFYPNFAVGDILYIKDFKIEEGNIATDWTPAPEDVDSAIENVKTITETNTTSISAIQGKITTLISNTTVIVDGKEKTLKDAYNGTVQTVNSINTTIGEHTSTLNTLNGTVSSNSSKITSIQTDLNGIKTSVSRVQSDLNSTKSQLSSLSSTLDGFESRVEVTESNLNNLSVGGRNYIKNSIFANGETYWNQVYSVSSIDKAFLFNNHATLKLSASGLTSDKWSGVTQRLNIDVAQGKTYTLSCYYYVQDLSTFDSALAFEVKAKREGLSDVSIGRAYIQKDSLIEGEWTKITKTVTVNRTDLNNPFVYVWLQRNGTAWFTNFKLEEGTIATDWTPAPEDVEAYTDTQISNAKTELQGEITAQISSAKSEIKQTTDSISQSVSSVNSSITTITNTLDTKAEKSTVEGISDSVTSLDTSLSGITGRVSGLESDTTTLTNKIDNLSVGGTNLLLNTGFNNTNNYLYRWTKYRVDSTKSIDEPTAISKKALKIIPAESKGGIFQNYDFANKFKEGETYTVSFYVKADSESVLISKRENSQNELNFNLTDSWQKFSYSFTQSSNSGGSIIFYTLSGVTFYLHSIKVEKGNMATDWTPAPEDAESYTETQISNAKSEINQTTDNKISTAKGEINQATDDKISNAKTELREVITTQISSAKSEIKQTTDSISQSVSNIKSSITTINNTLGNKAEKSTVESISNSVASLNTSLSGITGRVSSLESNTTTLTTKIDNLSVGGRNYIKNSIFANGKTYWDGSSSVSSIDKAFLFDNHATLKLSTSGLTSDGWRGVTQNLNVDVAQGKTYALSCYYYVQDLSTFDSALAFEVKAKREGLSEVGIGRAYVPKNSIIEGKWTKISATLTINRTDISNLFVYAWIQRNGTAWFTNFKLEEGTMATDWSPAPEDVENEITTVQEKVTSNTTEISALKNSITLKVDSTEMTSYKETVNGQLNTINSNISSMQSSIDLQLASIKSSVSKTVSTKNLINNSAFNKPLGTYSANGTVKSCEIVPKSTYTSWGNETAPVASDNILLVRFDVGGDNYVHFKDIFAKVKPSTTYTFSYYCHLLGNVTGPSSFLYERTASQSNQIVHTNAISIGPDTTSNGKGWVRKITSFTTRSDTDSVMVRFGFQSTDGATRMLIAGLQLEEGSQATDWVEGNTSSVGTIITQSPTDVMTAFNGISQYFEVSASGAKFGNISTGDYMAFNDRGLVRYIANQERRYIYMVQPRTFTKTLDERKPALTTAQKDVGRTGVWDDLRKNMPNAKDYAQTFTLNYDQELKDLLAGFAPQYNVAISRTISNPSNLVYDGLSSGSQDGYVGEDYITDTYIEVVSMTSTSITFKAGHICCVYEVTVDKSGLMKYYQFVRNYTGGKMTWYGMLFA